jgi:hypothetical protein
MQGASRRLYPLSLWLYGRAVDVGRKYGTLAGY